MDKQCKEINLSDKVNVTPTLTLDCSEHEFIKVVGVLKILTDLPALYS